MASSDVPRPFLKWAGGKTQLLEDLVARKPPHFARYFEPFLGGGALFFYLYRQGLLVGKEVVLSDLNGELIDTYHAIAQDVDRVLETLEVFRRQHSKEFYYELRAKDNHQLSPAERAARMIYLNKTGYNGLYRVNRQGKFNVPFGRYKSPRIYDEDNLRAVADALQHVKLYHCSFEKVLSEAQSGDWVYCDPPYVPLSKTANFTAYQANGFSANDQRRLRDVCVALAERGAYVMLSNSDTSFVRELYGTATFYLSTVYARRAINRRGRARGAVAELLITTYPLSIPNPVS